MVLKDSKLLMVGAGGIGCELLKNLILTGFNDIEVIDLDTIELSNLNRQFLFQKCHVGKPKAITAKESVLRYNPDAKIVAHHDSIMNTKYDVKYFKQFAVVLNALDNKAARSHVNRLCLAAEVPLIESGSAGYLGQVTLIKKNATECYDCLPKPARKSFPGCTIRNTPSEPIHCIVWAKHLFNQLFGAEDPDEAVSPDGEDPENMADAGKAAVNKDENEEAVSRVSTRQWAVETGYNAEKIFNKLFCDDVKYLLSMAKLWETRKPPTPLDWESCINDTTKLDKNQKETSTSDKTKAEEETSKLESHKIHSMQKYCEIFRDSIALLKNRLEESSSDEPQILVWDKDDNDAMDFVSAASNLRCFIFSIAPKSQFETKSLAGNIIPAIATTNAIVAGLIVLQALKVLEARIDDCKTVYVRDKPSGSNKTIVGSQLVKPNEKCYVCASKPEIIIKLNVNTLTIKQFETKILKQELNMVQPDVEIDDGTGRIIISSEEGETEENNEKFLSHFGIADGTALKCDDFFQNYELKIILLQSDKLDEDNTKEYEIVSENQMLKDLQANIEKDKEASSKSDSEASKRKFDLAFEVDDVSKASDIEEKGNKKPRRSEELEFEIVQSNDCDLIEENQSKSINDASDALSEEDEQPVQPKVVHRKPAREIIIDDDIIIEENSNDMKTEEEYSNGTTEETSNQTSNNNTNQFYVENTNSNMGLTNEESNDDDIIECSSDSDVIEINDNERHSDSSFVSIKNYNSTNGHLNGSSGQNGQSNENSENVKPAYQNSNGNKKLEETEDAANDECITLIE